MSWMSRLYQTYEQAMALEYLSPRYKPMPICHTIQNSHIIITISGAGEFRHATVEKQTIILPATERSAGRANGEAAHALADKLQYVAADYAKFGGLKPAYFASYREQLSQWGKSEYNHPSIQAILTYVDKETTVQDLITEGVLHVDDENCLLTQWTNIDTEQPELFKSLPKDKGRLDQGSALVCWVVESTDVKQPKTWLDGALQDAWVKFDSQSANITALCYVSGNIEPIAQNHPAKLRHSGDKAKLISSNDQSGFTFRGRFTDTKKSIDANGLQAATISSITTQKAHNALRWLIQRQPRSARNGDQVTIAWAISSKEIPHPFDEGITAFDEPDFDDVTEGLPTENIPQSPDNTIDLGQTYSNKLHRYMSGFKEKIAVDDSISIMVLDAATPGRMGIAYYRESIASEYIDQITRWHEDFAWHQRIVKEVTSAKGKPFNKASWIISAPTPYTIVSAVYGDVIKSNESLKKTLYERLLPCIVSEAPMPIDIVQRAIAQAVNPQNKEHKKYWEWERCLGVACALIRGSSIRTNNPTQGRAFSMSLDKTITSRSYLFGRLLAIAEAIESKVLNKEKINRPTSANRLMHHFSKKPSTTWLTIYQQIDPYMQKLASQANGAGFLVNMKKEMDDIMGAFEKNDDYVEDTPLESEFLIGFHCQRLALRYTNKDDQPTDNKDGE